MGNWKLGLSFIFFTLSWGTHMFSDKDPWGLALVGCMFLVLGILSESDKP